LDLLSLLHLAFTFLFMAFSSSYLDGAHELESFFALDLISPSTPSPYASAGGTSGDDLDAISHRSEISFPSSPNSTDLFTPSLQSHNNDMTPFDLSCAVDSVWFDSSGESPAEKIGFLTPERDDFETQPFLSYGDIKRHSNDVLFFVTPDKSQILKQSQTSINRANTMEEVSGRQRTTRRLPGGVLPKAHLAVGDVTIRRSKGTGARISTRISTRMETGATIDCSINTVSCTDATTTNTTTTTNEEKQPNPSSPDSPDFVHPMMQLALQLSQRRPIVLTPFQCIGDILASYYDAEHNTAEENQRKQKRRDLLERYRKKRASRVWKAKCIKYPSRSQFASVRPRCKGRFLPLIARS